MVRFVSVVAVAGLILAGCTIGPKDIVILTKSLKKQGNVNTSVPMEFGATATPAGSVYWVEGTVQNTGEKDYRNVQIGFKCSDGTTKKIMTAIVPLLQAGKTVAFKTQQEATQLNLRLLDESPDIYFER
jgi:hypothetical protein